MKRSRGTTRRVVTVAVGSGGAQLLLALGAPVLGRIYGPMAFGVFGLVAAVLRVGGIVGSGGFQLALPLERDQERACALLAVGLGWATIASLVGAVATGALVDTIPAYLGAHGALFWMSLTGVGVWAAAAWQLATGWRNRRGEYRRIAGSRVVRAGAGIGIQGLLGVARTGAGGLIGGRVAGDLVGALYLGLMERAVLRGMGRTLHRGWRVVGAVLRDYKRFPLLGAPQAVVSTVSVELPNLVLPLYVDPTLLGNYTLAFRIVTLPAALLGEALRLVLLKEFGDVIGGESDSRMAVSRRTGTIAGLVIAVGVPATASLWWILPLVMGEEWLPAAACVVWLAPWAAALIISSPVVAFLNAVQRQDVLLGYNMVLLVGRYLAIRVGVMWGGFEVGVACLGIVSFLGVVGLIGWTLRYEHRTRGVMCSTRLRQR